ncbi:copper homeostasis protein CutC [Zobellella sp. DQSA1]|uniref:copper homeostasis protein CutC n=1 Tax=Zobellella sp. DQSA1 TaxID=3342386 RepID=UPI0035C0A137
MKLEICVDNVSSLLAAVAAGADRIELCAALALGGLTPSPGLMRQAAACGVPVHAMIRPRMGDFVYDEAEIETMLLDIDAVRAAGLAGVVLGPLNAEDRVDQAVLERLLERAKGLEVTFHRALDLSRDWRADLELLIVLGCQRVLTSGQAASAPDGAGVLAQMVAAARGRIRVMAGAGVDAANVAELVRRTGVDEVHLSASVRRGRPATLAMGGQDPGDYLGCDGDRVRAVRTVLAGLQP